MCVFVQAFYTIDGSPSPFGIGWCCDGCLRGANVKFVRISFNSELDDEVNESVNYNQMSEKIVVLLTTEQ